MTDSTSNTTWQGKITVGADFFEAYGSKMYSNPTLAILARELLQNSRDACVDGQPIRITLRNYEGDNAVEDQPAKGWYQQITCDDKGIGMDRDVLENVFLTVGGSLKANGSVGGFGIAKVAIFACNRGGWSVHTRDNYIDSATLLGTKVAARKGTRVTCKVYSEHAWRADDGWTRAQLFLRSNSIRNLWLNDTKVQPYEGKRFLGAFYWQDRTRIEVTAAVSLMGQVNRIFWRIGGLTQFITGTSEDIGQNIIVDIQGVGYKPMDEGYPLGTSREDIADWRIREEVNKFIQPLTRNRNTAKQEARKMEKAGKGKGRREHVINAEAGYIIVDQPSGTTAAERKAYRQIECLWAKMVELHNPQAKHGQVFGGMVAQQRSIGKGDPEPTYLINPQAFAAHWSHGDNPLAVILVMWHLATHEFTHDNYPDHDEDFTCNHWATSVDTVLLVTEHIAELRIIARKTLDSIEWVRQNVSGIL